MATRTEQKARTRQTILDGCAELLGGATPPTIEDIAAQTGVSRATIYRYFTSSTDIVWHVMSDREIEPPDQVADAAGTEPVERILAAERAVNDYIFGDPMGVRQFEVGVLQRVLDGSADDTDRPARRLRYIDAALEPLVGRLDPGAVAKLRHALALALGSEAFLALIDTCRLETDEARETTMWACRALVAQAMTEAGLHLIEEPVFTAFTLRNRSRDTRFLRFGP